MADSKFNIGIVGARGYAGAELITLIAQHPNLSLAFAASRSQIGQPVPNTDSLTFIDADPAHIAQQPCDAIVLATPDGTSHDYAAQIPEHRIIVDLSSDHRFEDTWAYGLSELNTDAIKHSTRISNPGCYATALQLAAAPLLPVIEGPIHAFGVSGYSGAGTTPSDRNNPELLADGITPYKLVDHTHEREATRHLNHPVRFSPHVAPYFRGITLTLHAHADHDTTHDELFALYHSTYQHADLIEVLDKRIPRVQDIANTNGAQIGGIALAPDARGISVVCVIDNLLKGASAQAIQNLNLALDLPMNASLLKEARV